MSKIDPSVWTAILIQVPVLMAAIAAWINSRSNGKKADVANAKLDETSAKVTENTAITQAGQAMTASKLDAAAAKLDENTALTAAVHNETTAVKTIVTKE